jgi:hypothetical protein
MHKILLQFASMNKHENMCFDLARWILKTLVLFILFYFLFFLIQFYLVYYFKTPKIETRLK